MPGGLVPIVPAAAIFDLGRGGDFAARPDAAMGYAATADAAARQEGHDVERGNVGAAPEPSSAGEHTKEVWAPPRSP